MGKSEAKEAERTVLVNYLIVFPNLFFLRKYHGCRSKERLAEREGYRIFFATFLPEQTICHSFLVLF